MNTYVAAQDGMDTGSFLIVEDVVVQFLYDAFLRKDEEGIQIMRILGRNMAYYLKCIEAGREKGIKQPEQEKINFTNFIS